jgi:glycosyltransferase involved in cell wall biosynthesis
MPPHRIIFVSWEYPPAFGGGIGTYVAAITRILASMGHDISVITVTDRPTPAREFVDTTGRAIEVIRLPIPRAAQESVDPTHTLTIWQQRAEQVSECLLGLMRQSARGPIDAIEFADYRGEGLTFLTSVPKAQRPLSIVRLHTPLIVLNRYNQRRKSASVLEAFENDAIIAADSIVSPSRALAREMQELVGPLREREIVIHPYPFDAAFAKAAPPAPPTAADSSEVLYVGRLEERKGVQCLIDAAHAFLRACPTATLRLVGGDTPLSASEPSMLALLEKSIAPDIAPRIAFTKSIPREQLVTLYQSARFCVFPSLFENFPNVCLEAMSLARPVIGTTNSGMAEMIESGVSGVIVPSADAPALARAMIDLFNTPAAAREAMGHAAKHRVATLYDPPTIAASFIALTRGGGFPAPAQSTPQPTTAQAPTIGVVIPCYNHGEFIEETLHSVFAQTQLVHNIIIVDDGSPDAKTRDQLDALARKYADRNVRLIRQPNAGLAAARNTGVRALATDFYIPLDADDKLAPTFVEQTLPTLTANPTLGYAYTSVQYFGSHEGQWHCPPYDPAKLLVENLSVATALIRRSAFDAADGYNPAMVHGFEDWDFWLSLLKHGWHGTLVPAPLFHYRKHAQGSMLSRTQERRGLMISQMVQHHEGLYAHLLPYAITEKDRLFFRDHMDLWRLRESLARASHSQPPPPPDEPVEGAQSTPAQAELAFIERSFAWRTVNALKSNPIYDAVARKRWGDNWQLLEVKETPEQRLHRIKKSRSFKLILSIKGTPFYRMFAKMRYGG